METISFDFEDSEILWLALEAHARNITLNQLVNDILREEILRVESSAIADLKTEEPE